MRKLEWISLTGIGYAHPPPSGAEMPEELPIEDDSDEDSNNDDSGYYSHHYTNGTNGSTTAGPSEHRNGYTDSEDENDFYGDADSEEEPRDEVREIEFLDLNIDESPQMSLQCNCAELGTLNADTALDDDGGPISWKKAKIWERWVVNHCPVHGKR